MSHLPCTAVSRELIYKGRSQDPRIGELIQFVDAPPPKSSLKNLVLFGCPDDQGVTFNLGRAGAKGGPDSIRRHLYKFTPGCNLPERKSTLFDLGNIHVSHQIEETHANAETVAEAITASGNSFVALGGGHDFAAPNFLGFAKALKLRSTKNRLGLINVDPHLDVREREQGRPHSGSPFREILEKRALKGSDLVAFGIRANRNSHSHYQFCKKEKVDVVFLENILRGQGVMKEFKRRLSALIKRCSHIGITIDIDSCYEGEGSSAAPALGFSAWELCEMAFLSGASAKVGYLEIAEVAPALDTTQRTSRIAAEIVFAFYQGRELLRSTKN